GCTRAFRCALRAGRPGSRCEFVSDAGAGAACKRRQAAGERSIPERARSSFGDFMSKPRSVSKARKTNETDIQIKLNLDGSGQYDIHTGIPFFDHMLAQLARHGQMDLTITAKGDLGIAGHHAGEDWGSVRGQA